MLYRLLLVAMLMVLTACGRSSEESSIPTRSPAEVIATTTGVARTRTPGTTVSVPTLVPTRTSAPTNAPTETLPTDIPPTETIMPEMPSGIATVTPLPTRTPTATPDPTATATLEPTATATPDPTATSTPTPTATAAGIDPLPGDFKVVPWQGFVVPIPNGYDDRQPDEPNKTINDAPVLAQLLVEGHDNEQADVMRYTIIQFEGGAETWLDTVRDADGSSAVDDTTIEKVTVAGFPARTYESQTAVKGRPLNYVIEVARDRLLLIAIVRRFPTHQQSVAALEYDGITAPAPSATPQVDAKLKGEIAYLDEGDIWLRELASTTSRQLTELGTVRDLAWSPDGRRIAFAIGDENAAQYIGG